MISRRDLLKSGGFATAAVLSSNVSWAQGQPVKLLLVRETGYQNKCVPCISGKIYGVPSPIDLATAEQTLALLTPIADSVELSFEPGSGLPSSIPEGLYEAYVRAQATKRWMWTGGELNAGSVIMDRAWRLELNKNDTKPRTNIQFHYGKDASWSTGCIILGHKLMQCPLKGPCVFPDSPVSAVRALRGYVEANSMASNTPILVRIASA